MMLRVTVYSGEYIFHLVDMSGFKITFFGQLLTNEMWNKSGFLFEDYGFEIYEKMEIKMCLEHDIHQKAGALSKTEIRGMYSPVLL